MLVEELPLSDALDTIYYFITFDAGNNDLSIIPLTLMTLQMLISIFLILVDHSVNITEKQPNMHIKRITERIYTLTLLLVLTVPPDEAELHSPVSLFLLFIIVSFELLLLLGSDFAKDVCFLSSMKSTSFSIFPPFILPFVLTSFSSIVNNVFPSSSASSSSSSSSSSVPYSSSSFQSP
ncbi:hypothetical protein HanRHA438_Chr11g0512351 [Helianthus annuus]|nr:hypothetical protein HanHA300_Chr11g0410111 [Helianthus annuus]KAJ0510187.1 hypothetical protein HanIR_Chr11g0537891 [Helianthus annuus]KAJ0518125.1 hypothetical protein HanHA89_Chr11g0433801 [Helianthus annuus]KAJ0686150.1 hypothetical protein HanLR1_Chr11g0411391 [Helianthus annuus]KAJ0689990.1 hypothetical protein HanOQP8_Chr11g0412681 [Helianthus annuus]